MSKALNQLANSVDPDEMVHYEQSYLELHCLQKYKFWSTGLKGLNVGHLFCKDWANFLKPCQGYSPMGPVITKTCLFKYGKFHHQKLKVFR